MTKFINYLNEANLNSKEEASFKELAKLFTVNGKKYSKISIGCKNLPKNIDSLEKSGLIETKKGGKMSFKKDDICYVELTKSGKKAAKEMGLY